MCLNNYMETCLNTCSNVYCIHVDIPVWAAYCHWHHKFETPTRLIHSTIQTEVDGVWVCTDTGRGGHDPGTVN